MFRAYEPEQDRLVAVKLFRLDLSPDRVQRLVAELEQLIAADLTHPAIATPIATGVAGVTAYLAQDFVAAESLDTHVRDRRVSPPSEVVRVMTQVAAALDIAAAGRVVHGALHPRDLLVSSDDVRVTGLGIARALERVGITAPVRRPYTAPERVGGRAWDRRADVFSLAVLAHEMLWGRRPSATGTRAADGLTELPGADLAGLRALFGRALAETFTDRFDSAERLVDALRAALGTAADVREVDPTLPARRRRSTSPVEAGEGVTPAQITESADVVAEVAPGERDRPFFDVDRFRAASELERFLPEPLLPTASIEAVEAVAHPAAEATSGAQDESPAPAALADAAITPVDAESEPPTQDVAPPRPPGKVARSEPDRRPRARDRTAPPDARGVRVESSLFLEAAESAIASTVSPGNGGAGATVALTTPAGGVDMGARDDLSLATLDRTGSAVWPLAMALGVGIALGFAVGYGVGGRQRAQSPSSTAEAAPSPTAPAQRPPQAGEALAPPAAAPSAPAAALETRPAEAAPSTATAGATEAREATTPVDLPPPAPSVARPTPSPAAAPAPRAVQSSAGPARSPRPSVPARSAPAPAAPSTATLLVDSRPAGASVFVDGRLIGTTPLSLPNVATGDHAVRIELAGYNQWTASVSLEGGERRRVAASLER